MLNFVLSLIRLVIRLHINEAIIDVQLTGTIYKNVLNNVPL